VRPSDILNFDDPMKPAVLDQFIELTGAESIPYLKKMLCCGAGLRMVDTEKSLKLVEMKLGYVEAAEADCMAVLCPYCMIQYDLTQRMIKREGGSNPQMPVLYYAEMLCLAMGMQPKELGLRLHRTSIEPVLKKLEMTA